MKAPPYLRRKKKFSFKDLTEKFILEFSFFAKASNVEIKFTCEKGLPRVFADPFQIGQVIENLIDNAIRYTKGKRQVFVKIEKKGKNVYFEIKDGGVGIPKKDQKQ